MFLFQTWFVVVWLQIGFIGVSEWACVVSGWICVVQDGFGVWFLDWVCMISEWFRLVSALVCCGFRENSL